jgi:thiamine biosynthesis lipoprotein
VGTPVEVSVMLLEAMRFALALAEQTSGAFDPTIGHRMEAEGFNVEYRTGERRRTFEAGSGRASYEDVHIDAVNGTIALARPLMLDLGAVAKGMAVDLAARELGVFENFAIDAGGDVYLRGGNGESKSWRIGVRHPRDGAQLVETLAVTNAAVCTSGDYERRNEAGRHHVLDPRTGAAADACASVTVIAPTAIVADGLATAALVLGPRDGLSLIEANGAEALMVTPALERVETPGIRALAARTIAAGDRTPAR